MYVRGPRILALPLALQLLDCGHYRAVTPDDHDVALCIAALNRSLDAALKREPRPRPEPVARP